MIKWLQLREIREKTALIFRKEVESLSHALHTIGYTFKIEANSCWALDNIKIIKKIIKNKQTFITFSLKIVDCRLAGKAQEVMNQEVKKKL